ncbi:hypothetical protein NEDG_01877 [Nematocida displodere]|uniref:Uncharacterized protein n=1 Tax=Nematocida displodere TaxID=1805483 RepID=A0A177EGL5_9MICR|nr:hypothetical protein NEDG_01877 [Nematocida displodere]
MGIQKVSIGRVNGYILQEEGSKVFFDPPGVVFDGKVKISEISKKMKYVEIEVLKEYPPAITAVFLSSSESLGVFFTKSTVPIYTTEIIYLQMKERIRHFMDLGPIRCTGVDAMPSSSGTETFEISQYRSIASRVRLLSFSEVIEFAYFSVGIYPGGTCIGWPLYTVKRGEERVMAYTYAIPGMQSLSMALPRFKEKLPLLVNTIKRRHISCLAKFTTKIKEITPMKESVVITMEIMNHSIEMVLHLLSITRTEKILICHRGFKKLVQLSELKRRFLAQRFSSDSKTSAAPILSAAKRVEVVSRRALLSMSEKKLKGTFVICEMLDYTAFFKHLPVIHLDEYSIRLFGNLKEAHTIPWIDTLYLPIDPTPASKSTENVDSTPLTGACTPLFTPTTPKALFPLTSANTSPARPPLPVVILTEKEEGVDLAPPLYSLHIHNLEHIQEIIQTQNTLQMHFRGTFRAATTGLSLVCEESPLNGLSSLPDVEKIVIDNITIYKTPTNIIKVKEVDGMVYVSEHPLPSPNQN